VGRSKKYFTVEEKKEAGKKASKKYYWKNKSEIDRKATERYQNSKKDGNSLPTQKESR
jgi:hypothetical protein